MHPVALILVLAAATGASKPAATAKPAPAATAKSAPAATAKPAAAVAAAPAGIVETILPESVLASLLVAAAPFDETMEQEVGGFGFTHTVELKVHLSDPKVHVAADGIHVTMNYHLQDASGVIDTSGVATPLLQITPIPAKQILEARFTHSGVTMPGGIELPLEDLVDPIEIPAVMPQDVDVGTKTVTAEFRVTEVTLEEGRVRLRGTMAFRPKAAATK